MKQFYDSGYCAPKLGGLSGMVADFVRLTLAKKSLKAELLELESMLDEAEVRARDAMIQAGVDKITVNGMTVFPRKNTYPKAKDGDQLRAVSALVAAGMLEYVGVGHMRLRSLLNEDPDALPPEVAACFDLTEHYKLSVTRA